jgi:ElaB/YqjD/DUF883 family membrane-anchored ribosome-binding protein
MEVAHKSSPVDGSEPGEADASDASSERRAWTSEEARRLLERGHEWVQEHPFAALGIAAATGFIVGRVVRRW